MSFSAKSQYILFDTLFASEFISTKCFESMCKLIRALVNTKKRKRSLLESEACYSSVMAKTHANYTTEQRAEAS